MSDFKEIFKKTAQSACITISEKDAHLFSQLESIMKMLNRLNSVNTEGVEPLLSVGAEIAPQRQDIAIQQDPQNLKCAHMMHGYFRLLKFVE